MVKYTFQHNDGRLSAPYMNSPEAVAANWPRNLEEGTGRIVKIEEKITRLVAKTVTVWEEA